MFKRIFMYSILSSVFTLMGCQSIHTKQVLPASDFSTFNAKKAIQQVLKEQPDFPSTPTKTITKELKVGGKAPGLLAVVDYTTEVTKENETTYIITLKKDWHLTINGTKIMSYWKYKVTPETKELVASDIKDELVNIIK